MPRRKFRLSTGAQTTIYLLIAGLIFILVVTVIWGC